MTSKNSGHSYGPDRCRVHECRNPADAGSAWCASHVPLFDFEPPAIVHTEEADYFAAKADQGKPRPSLLPWGGLRFVLEVCENGLASGYGKHSWKTVPNAVQRYSEAYRRHSLDVMEDIWARDRKSGLYSLAHAVWNGLALLAFKAVEERTDEG